MLSNFASALLNNLAPPASCLLCGADSAHQALCDGCTTTLPWLPTLHCPICALPTQDGGLCGSCLKTPPAFDCTHASFLYTAALTQMIPAAKFGTRWSLLPVLAKLMLPKLANRSRPELMIPLPLHPGRLRERGFNQALEIAQPLSVALNIPLGNTQLQRIKDTEHQARLTEKARHSNMRRAFVALEDLEGRHIAVVDDVMTTGASLDAAARALKDAGASKVEAWVLARTP